MKPLPLFAGIRNPNTHRAYMPVQPVLEIDLHL